MTRLPLPRPIPTFTGKIITLRPLHPHEDAPDYFKWNLNPEVHLWTGNKPHRSVDEAYQELVRFQNMENISMWSIIDHQSKQMMGRFFVCLEMKDSRLVAGEGNRIAKEFWRKGHNKEARQFIYDYVFDCLGADRIESDCWAENINSRLSLLANGFELVGVEQKWNDKRRYSMNYEHFILLSERWRRRNENLPCF